VTFATFPHLYLHIYLHNSARRSLEIPGTARQGCGGRFIGQ